MKYRARRPLLGYGKGEIVESGDHSPDRLSSFIRLGLLEPVAPKPRPRPTVVITDDIPDILNIEEIEEDA